MKRLIGLLLLISSVLVMVGCVPMWAPAPPLPDVEPTPTPTPEPAPMPSPIKPTPVPFNGESDDIDAAAVLPNIEPPDDVTWISPGKVMVAHFYPGARAEYPLTIHNGEMEISCFDIEYRPPDHVREGYVEAPDKAKYWVIIADPTPVLTPGEVRDILVVLEMPEGAKAPPKWEFWIGVKAYPGAKNTTQTGLVVVELASRWCVSMRQ